MDTGRRSFFRRQRPVAPYRPPWAVEESLFTRYCTRCGACVEICPTKLLTRGTGGFPEANFHQGYCTFCAHCANACAENARPPALAFSPALRPWPLRASISTNCLPLQGVMCRACEEHCEEEAIRFIPRRGIHTQPDIKDSVCTGCGKCVASCPARAISLQAILPLSAPDAHPHTEKTHI